MENGLKSIGTAMVWVAVVVALLLAGRYIDQQTGLLASLSGNKTPLQTNGQPAGATAGSITDDKYTGKPCDYRTAHGVIMGREGVHNGKLGCFPPATVQ